MSLLLGIVIFIFLVVLAHMLDDVGVGYLLSSDVDRVADARLAEAPLSIPPLYIVASLAAGTGAILEFPELAPLARWAIGVGAGLVPRAHDMGHAPSPGDACSLHPATPS